MPCSPAFLLASGVPAKDHDSLMLSTQPWARSTGLDVPNHRLDTLMDLVGFEMQGIHSSEFAAISTVTSLSDAVRRRITV